VLNYRNVIRYRFRIYIIRTSNVIFNFNPRNIVDDFRKDLNLSGKLKKIKIICSIGSSRKLVCCRCRVFLYICTTKYLCLYNYIHLDDGNKMLIRYTYIQMILVRIPSKPVKGMVPYSDSVHLLLTKVNITRNLNTESTV